MTGRWVRHLSEDGKTQYVDITAQDPKRGSQGRASAAFDKSAAPESPRGPAAGVRPPTENRLVAKVLTTIVVRFQLEPASR